MKLTNQYIIVLFGLLLNMAAAEMIFTEESPYLHESMAKFYKKHSCKINYIRHYYNEFFANQKREHATPIVTYACFCDETQDFDIDFGDEVDGEDNGNNP